MRLTEADLASSATTEKASLGRSPTTAVLPGLMIPALCQAILEIVGPSVTRWSNPTLVMTLTIGSITLVVSNRPPAPTSTTAISTARSANHQYPSTLHASA